MIEKFDYGNIDRIVYIWARYAGTRDATKEGKHYDKYDINELIRKLTKFRDNPDSFNNGFEKDDPMDDDLESEDKTNG